MEEVKKEQIVKDLRSLGLAQGDLVNVKMSLKSIGRVPGGAKTVLDAILEVIGPEGTIVTDSFVHVYRLPIIRNKESKVTDEQTPSYAGALANAILEHPSVFRSTHPIQKFAAIGRLAKELMLSHTPDSYAYDVLRKMANMGGKNLKIGTDEKVVGVGTTHVAIGSLGLKQKCPSLGVFYKNKFGEIELFKLNWSGICSKGLIKFIPYYREAGAILSEGYVGEAVAKITDMNKTLDVELKILKKDPTFFFCDDPFCDGCRLTWTFSEKKYGQFLLNCLRGKKYKKIARVFLIEPIFEIINKI
ncbi:AAC(3) family N-acetyltransferase [Aminobacterium sp. UBA5514]|uniref:AAC(3) family N-acetyltransferase n=1 Tax=Aminobacterium sp. UBA5514 TaxID=1946036 RepID=UPI00257BEF89|nr:AAC(3) family N-acetyltransferase [Aminobacterium sp. UBA5514]